MSRTCPQCGNLNNDDVKFCTTCGSPLVRQPDPSGLLAIPQTGAAAAGPPTDHGRVPKILFGAVIAMIVIIAALGFLQVSGTFRIFPSAVPAVMSPATLTPEVTPGIPAATPVPTTTPAENMTSVTTTPDLPVARPTLTNAVSCPSDRRACGANCTDLMTDRDNCGDCDVSCFPGQICQAGRCTGECSFGESRCFDGCYNLSYDAQNCGTCGNTCPFGLVCNRSVCTPPVTTVIPTYSG
ncbi:MAG: zinc-ribbon domain-containing protein [Methanoregula sp.]|nr:zinc-ribbon domain-containing protein [Methanoregula sp.]